MPLRYVVNFALGLLLFSSGLTNAGQGALGSLLSLPLNELFSIEFWRGSSLHSYIILLSAIFVAFGVFMERLVAELLFWLINRNSSYREKIRISLLDVSGRVLDVSDRVESLGLVDRVIKSLSKKLAVYTCLAQTSFSFSAYIILRCETIVEIAVAVLILVVALLAVVRSVQYFVSEYFPFIVLRHSLEGRSFPRSLMEQ